MNDKIEAMIIMAKGKTGRALEDVIDRILSQPEIFVFGEFIEMPNVQQVRNNWTLTYVNFSLTLTFVVGSNI